MGAGSIQLFRVAGIRLELHFTFLLFGAFFALSGAGLAGMPGFFWFSAFFAAIFTCVVLHELGHCLAARFYGINVSRILLLPVGGMAQFERIPRNPWQEIVISLAGPLVNFVLAVGLVLPAGLPRPWTEIVALDLVTFLHGLLLVNVIMGLFNLLPIFPMDGGRIFRALLALRISYVQATSIAANLAKILAVVGVITAILVFQDPVRVILPTILFAIICIGGDMEYRMVKRRAKTSGLFVGDLMSRNYLSLTTEQPMSAALELFLAYRPAEMLVTEKGVPHGILTNRAVRRAQRRGWLHHPVGRHTCRQIRVLQAGWPLDPFMEMIAQSRQRLYPVYSFGNLVGVLDTRNLDNMIAWKRLEERSHREVVFPD